MITRPIQQRQAALHLVENPHCYRCDGNQLPRQLILSHSWHQRRYRIWSFLCLVLLLLLLTWGCVVTAASDDGQSFVDEILKEHAADNHDDDERNERVNVDSRNKEELRRKQQEELHQQQQQQQENYEHRRRQEHFDQIRLEREAAYTRELEKTANDIEARKRLQRQKRRDSNAIQQILRAAKRGDPYAVLGLRPIARVIMGTVLGIEEVQIQGRSIDFFQWKWSLPSIRLFHFTVDDIKKAFRKQARTVHPDKNRDGRAEEAFWALEEAMSLLMDPQRRDEYDQQVTTRLQRQRAQATRIVTSTVSRSWRFTGQVMSICRHALGPFAFPVSVLGALLI